MPACVCGVGAAFCNGWHSFELSFPAGGHHGDAETGLEGHSSGAPPPINTIKISMLRGTGGPRMKMKAAAGRGMLFCIEFMLKTFFTPFTPSKHPPRASASQLRRRGSTPVRGADCVGEGAKVACT